MSSNQIIFNEDRLSNVLKSFFQSSVETTDVVKKRIIQNHNSSLEVTSDFNKHFETLFGKKEPTIDNIISSFKSLVLQKNETLEYCLFKYSVKSKDLGLSTIKKVGNVELDIDKLLAEINIIRSYNKPPQNPIPKDKFITYLNIKLQSSKLDKDKFTDSEFFDILVNIFKPY